MDNQMEVYGDIVMENYVGKNKKKWIWTIVCIAIALVSFFIISKWATSVETYCGVMGTLNSLQKKALELTGTSTALATGAAAIPGDATTPIANKLADVAGYMLIVYVAIIIEKYLLTLTGFVAFKIFLPIGFTLAAIGAFFRTEWKSFVYRIAIKCIVLGLLLWCLVPASAWITNWINETYENSINIDSDLVKENKNANAKDEDKDSDGKSDSNEKDKEGSGFSVGNVLSDFADKVSGVVKDAGEVASDKIEEFEDALNQLIEAVAVMIVTTCVIPILVMLLFIWILKIVTGLNLPVSMLQSIPRTSELVKKRKNVKKIKE